MKLLFFTSLLAVCLAVWPLALFIAGFVFLVAIQKRERIW
jgi:hypothetical protein